MQRPAWLESLLDTYAWLVAAFQVLTPVLAAIALTALAVYALFVLAFGAAH